MAHSAWTTKAHQVASLHLDPKNPRLGRETAARAPREIIQYLFDNDKAFEVAKSIAQRGFFPNEPLLAIKDGDQFVVVEGPVPRPTRLLGVRASPGTGRRRQSSPKNRQSAIMEGGQLIPE